LKGLAPFAQRDILGPIAQGCALDVIMASALLGLMEMALVNAFLVTRIQTLILALIARTITFSRLVIAFV